MSSAVSEKNKANKRIIHIIIALIIMFVIRFLPNLPNVTDPGMAMVGVFIGTLYLWFTIDTLTGSLISFVMICFSGYAGLRDVLGSYMNVTLIQSIFMMIMAGALVTTNVTQYIARFFLTVKINRGRPWVFAGMVCLGAFILSAVADWLAPIFLFWPILYEIFKEVGYEKGEKYPTILIILVVLGDVLGYHVFPFMRNPLTLIANFQALTEESEGGPVMISSGGYMATAFICSFLIIFLVILLCKLILRPDTSKIREFDTDSLNANPLPKMSRQQRIVSGVFILVLAFLILPALLGSVIPFMKTLAGYSLIIAVCGVTILCALQVDGKPVINFGKIVRENVSWEMIAMIATALLLASALTNEATGVTVFLKELLSPVFASLGYIPFIVIVLCVTVLLTNFCNSFVIGVIMSPIVATYCSSTGTNPAPIVMLVIFTTLATAMGTPSASPFAATLYGNTEWLETKHIYKYSFSFIAIELIVLLAAGIPLALALVK